MRIKEVYIAQRFGLYSIEAFQTNNFTMFWKPLTRTLATAASSVSSNVSNLQDIVIIGGGPAGLSILASLKSSHKTRHLKCTLIEGSNLDPIRDFSITPPDTYTNRVVSLTPKSIEFMQERIGNWDFINIDRIKFYDSIVAYDGQDSNTRISFDGSTSESGVLAAMCENFNIQSSLLAKIDDQNLSILDPEEEQESIILDNTKVVSIDLPLTGLSSHSHSHSELAEIDPNEGGEVLDWPIVKLDNGESIQARLLIGADGYNSPVRKFANIESRGWQYNRFGVVATIKLQYEDYRSVGWQRFLTTGPLAILPLTDDNATIVWSTTPENSELLLKVNDIIFPHLVTAAMTLEEIDLKYILNVLREDPNDMSVLDEISWRLSKMNISDLEENFPLPVTELVQGSRARFPLKLSHADTYVAPRVALVGDAAHTIHPLAGQGLNMGQSDVSYLIDALEKGVDRGLDIGSTLVLENYVANAWPSNHVILGACDKLHKIFATDWAPIVFVRSFGMNSLNSLGVVKDLMIKAISGR